MFEVMYRCMQVRFHVTIFEELYSMDHIATDQFTATTQRSKCYQYYIILSFQSQTQYDAKQFDVKTGVALHQAT